MTGPATSVTWSTLSTPFGPLLLAATDVGLVRIALPGEDQDVVLATLADRVGPVIDEPEALATASRELEEYFAGKRRTFDHPLDWRLTSGFRRTVLHRLRDVPYGTTQSYARLAAAADNPAAARAAGSACATNPLPIVVPCHRVVRSDGSIGRYGGGTAMKAALLAMESSTRAADVPLPA